MFCSAVFCYGIAYAVLDSAGLWRRIVLGITAVVLTLAMVPAFAVWDIYFSPFVQLVGVFWSWFCVVLYTQHHQMPCDPMHVDIQMGPSEELLMQPMDHVLDLPMDAEHVHEQEKRIEREEDKYKPPVEEVVRGEDESSEKEATEAAKSVKPAKKSAKKKRSRKRSKRK